MSLSYVDSATGLLTLVKQPGTNRTFTMDFSGALLGAKIAAVASVNAARTNRFPGSAPVVLSAPTFTPTAVSFRIGGGTSGEAYKVTVVVVDDAGNTIEGDGLLLVKGA